MKRSIQILVLALFMLPLLVQAQTINRNWKCTAPVVGSAPVRYHWEVSADDPITWTAYSVTEDTLTTVNVPYDWSYIVRVRAEDAQGEYGIWSPVSDVDVVRRPGVCGKPENY